VQGRVIGENEEILGVVQNEEMLVMSENDGAFVTEPTGSEGPALRAFEASMQGFGLEGVEHSGQGSSGIWALLIIDSQ